MSEFQPIKGARHVNVGEDDANVVAALEDQNCFLCICRLDNIKPRSSDHVDRVGADQERILNNQTTGLCSRVGCFTMNLYVLQRRLSVLKRSLQRRGWCLRWQNTVLDHCCTCSERMASKLKKNIQGTILH